LSAAQKRLEICETIIEEQHYFAEAPAIVGNDLPAFFAKVVEVHKTLAAYLRDKYPKNLAILNSFQSSLRHLAEIPLHPALRVQLAPLSTQSPSSLGSSMLGRGNNGGSPSPTSSSPNPSAPKTLLDLVVMEHALKLHERCEIQEAHLQEKFAEITRDVEEVKASSASDILASTPSSSFGGNAKTSAQYQQFAGPMREQFPVLRELAGKFLSIVQAWDSDMKRVFELIQQINTSGSVSDASVRDASLFSDVLKAHNDQLPLLRPIESQMETIMLAFINAKQDHFRVTQQKVSSIGDLASKLRLIWQMLRQFRELVNKHRTEMMRMKFITLLPTNYDAYLKEVGRRRGWSRKFNAEISRVQSAIQKATEEEKIRRDAFQQAIGASLPAALAGPLVDPAPSVNVVVSPAQFDTELPEIEPTTLVNSNSWGNDRGSVTAPPAGPGSADGSATTAAPLVFDANSSGDWIIQLGGGNAQQAAEELKASRAAQAEFEREMRRLMSENNNLKTDLQKSASYEAHISGELSRLSEEASSYKTRALALEQSVSELTQSQQSAQALAASLRAELEDFKRQQQSLVDSSAAPLQAQLKELDATIQMERNRMTEKINNLKSEYDTMIKEREEQISKVQVQLDVQSSDAEALQFTLISQTEELNNLREESERQMSALRAERDRLAAQASSAASQSSESSSQLKRFLTEAQTRLTSVTQERDLLKRRADEVSEEKATLALKYSELAGQMASTKTKNALLDAQVGELQSSFARMGDVVASMEVDLLAVSGGPAFNASEANDSPSVILQKRLDRLQHLTQDVISRNMALLHALETHASAPASPSPGAGSGYKGNQIPVTVSDFEAGNVVMFVRNPKGYYEICHSGKFPNFYLDDVEGRYVAQIRSGQPILAVIIMIERSVADAVLNPYSLEVGVEYHRVICDPLT
jgi:hypothetical protein